MNLVQSASDPGESIKSSQSGESIESDEFSQSIVSSVSLVSRLFSESGVFGEFGPQCIC